MMTIAYQIAYLFILAIPVACIAWTFTHEQIFSEVHDYCSECSKKSRSIIKKKFFYLFTCEYCFSHYVTALLLIVTKYHLLYDGWRGYIIAGFSLVWIANIYMSIYNRVRVILKKEKIESEIIEKEKTNTPVH